MHSGAINREYKFKFYLNANHYIIIDGKEGEQHPHTWEFMVHIRMNGQKFVQFDAYEKAIDEYFNQYQNHLINEIEPFDPYHSNIGKYVRLFCACDQKDRTKSGWRTCPNGE